MGCQANQHEVPETEILLAVKIEMKYMNKIAQRLTNDRCPLTKSRATKKVPIWEC